MKVMINDAAILTRRNSGGILEGKKRCLLLGAFLVFNWDALYLQGFPVYNRSEGSCQFPFQGRLASSPQLVFILLSITLVKDS